MDPVIASSAHKHGIDDEAIRHAYDHPIRVADLDDGLVMLIGSDHAGNLLEVGVATSAEQPVIVHAMSARTKYLR